MIDDSGQNDGSAPQQQGNNREVGYGRPPVEHRFKPGESGNPGGRPRGRTLYAVLHEILEDDAELEEVARAFLAQMKKGSFPHLKEVIDREEGKVPDRVANADGSNVDQHYDLTRLSLDELLLIRAAQQKAAVQPDENVDRNNV
jgi:hypothetical protein